MRAAAGWLAGLLSLLGAAVALAQDRPKPQQFMARDADFCFARTYDAVHLARNKTQQIVQLRIGAKAGSNVHGQRDLPYHEIVIALAVRTRTGTKTEIVIGFCTDYEETNEPGAEPGLNCDLACKSDKLVVGAVDRDTIVVRNRGLRTSCEARPIRGAADANFHLRRQPATACAELAGFPDGE